ncbi:MAG: protein kinase [Acidobacteria bacterium]|nr:protein kinase [Acidobacteriota bacterium]
MPLSAGTRLGPYEILSPLGAGGMGEVYRARDTKLDREVAIKVLPAEFAADPDRLRRFEQEARSAGKLNHPNILTVHDLGSHEGSPYLVTELIEGETLREKLEKGLLPISEAVGYAVQFARGIAAAHDQGIFHRDLKPENLFLTPDRRLKILDFGLAKQAPTLPAGMSPTQAPTVMEGTRPGILLGTVSYMSPEQVRGIPADARSDRFAFGAVLYEMLTGRRAFSRDNPAETLAAILRDDPPDLLAIRPETPQELADLVRRCLQKAPERRPPSSLDLVKRLDDVSWDIARGDSARRRALRMGGVGAALLMAVALILYGWMRQGGRGSEETRTPTLFQVTIAEGTEDFPAFSPESRRLAFSSESGGVRHIVLKDIAARNETPATGGEFDEIQPAWMPDGSTLLFVRARKPGQRLEPGDIFGRYSGGDIWSRDVASGREVKLIENAFNPAPSPDGQSIAVDAAWVGPSRIWLTDRLGHNPQQLTSDSSEAVDHLRPRWSADGKRIVFQNQERTKFDVRVVDVSSKKLGWVTDDAFLDVAPSWSPSGRQIIFSSHRSGGLNLWGMPVAADGSPAGRAEQITTGAGQDVNAAFSPDGRRLVFAILRQNASLWELPVDPASGRLTGAPKEVIGTTREESRAAWSPDGSSIAFNSDREGDMNIWVANLTDGSSHRVTKGPGGDYQPNWSPDGRRLAFFSSRTGNSDLWSVDVQSLELKALTHDRAMEINPFYSPDGRSIAYQSDASGRLEVWILDVEHGTSRQLTSVGVTGHFLRWSRDSALLYFRCPGPPTSEVMRIAVSGGQPEPLAGIQGGSHLSFSPDDSRIMDVIDHKALWVSSLAGNGPEKVFQFDDPSVRIDYPVWSPDGRWILFDRFSPRGGDIWWLEGI